MKIERVAFDIETFGTTKPSLAVLQDSLDYRDQHRLAVVQVDVGDIRCGFFVIDADAGVAVFTGDGFRHDYGGEGGAGYRKAQELCESRGLRIFNFGQVSDLELLYPLAAKNKTDEIKTLLSQVVKRIVKSFRLNMSDCRAPAKA